MNALDAPAPINGLLYRGQTTIKARVWIRCHVRTISGMSATGFPTFGAGYGEYVWQVTDAVLNTPKISIERPRWQGDEESTLREISCTIELETNGGLLAVTQDGAALRRSDIEQGTVIVLAEVGSGNYIDWFSGRIAGIPSEQNNTMTIVAQSGMFEALRTPVTYENYGLLAGVNGNSSQTIGFVSGHPVDTMGRVPVRTSHYCATHGVVRFDGGGRRRMNLGKTGGPDIDLVNIGLGNEIKLGIYTITFRDAKNYVITYPDGQEWTSSIYGYVSGPAIQLTPQSWIGQDGSEAVFTIQVSWGGQGNPVAMAFNLVEKALIKNWGSVPTGAAFMDLPAWDAAIRRFESFTVHVDATNPDNSVWENRSTNRPLSVGVLAQQILDHVGCSLTLSIDGAISISIPYLDDVPAWPNSTTSEILGDGIKIEASEGALFNYLTAQYAWNGDSYGVASSPIDLRLIPTALKVEKVISFPFYKAGVGRRCVQWALETFSRRFLEKQTVISYQVHRGMGLLAQAGDRVTVVSDLQPRLEAVAEIYSVDKACGGDGNVKAQLIQSHEGPRSAVCSVLVGDTKLF